MLDAQTLEFALASLVVVAVPGPDQALITRNALVGGRKAGRRTVMGGASGITVHATAAALGVSALLATSATAYTALKIVGVAYLLYLGARMLLSRGEVAAEEARETRVRRPYVQGLLSNVLNPKVGLFFLTFLPQFLPADGAALPTALGLSAVFAAIYIAWFSGLVMVVDLVSDMLRRPRFAAWLERITGSAMVAFGVRLAAQSR
jgi:threonine/homoserine/homoserine lactone efflux protein